MTLLARCADSDLPDELDARAAAQLLDLLYAIADHLQHPSHQLPHYSAEPRDPPQSAVSLLNGLVADHDDLRV